MATESNTGRLLEEELAKMEKQEIISRFVDLTCNFEDMKRRNKSMEGIRQWAIEKASENKTILGTPPTQEEQIAMAEKYVSYIINGQTETK